MDDVYEVLYALEKDKWRLSFGEMIKTVTTLTQLYLEVSFSSYFPMQSQAWGHVYNNLSHVTSTVAYINDQSFQKKTSGK